MFWNVAWLLINGVNTNRNEHCSSSRPGPNLNQLFSRWSLSAVRSQQTWVLRQQSQPSSPSTTIFLATSFQTKSSSLLHIREWKPSIHSCTSNWALFCKYHQQVVHLAYFRGISTHGPNLSLADLPIVKNVAILNCGTIIHFTIIIFVVLVVVVIIALSLSSPPSAGDASRWLPRRCPPHSSGRQKGILTWGRRSNTTLRIWKFVWKKEWDKFQSSAILLKLK